MLGLGWVDDLEVDVEGEVVVEVRVSCLEEGVWMASYFGMGEEGVGWVVMVEVVERVGRVLIERVDEDEEGWGVSSLVLGGEGVVVVVGVVVVGEGLEV